MGVREVTEAATAVEQLRRDVDGALRRRDEAIRAAFEGGESIGAIAQAAHLTSERVASILGRPFERVGRPTRRPPVGGTE